MSLFQDHFLRSGEFFSREFEKDKIFIHHTAGSYRPDYVIDGWNADRTRSGGPFRVATAFVIGGKASNGPSNWDGVIVRAFPEEKWAYHLAAGNSMLDRSSIGIELCNWGQLTVNPVGQFFNYIGGIVPDTQVVEFEDEFRGFTYYHKYSEKQIEALGKLLEFLSNKFGINLKEGLQEWINKESLRVPDDLESTLDQQKWLNQNGFVGLHGEPLIEDDLMGRNTEFALKAVGQSGFEYNPKAVHGYPGLWTHTSVRLEELDDRDEKYDCSPQALLKELILSF
ncbi:MAG: N-acetylmuramoyl-L-alanine amidase [Bacteroidia bacterium]|nr:N-acetylmuramoyl-L-alanine amidase [Bacteroidia bacterium]